LVAVFPAGFVTGLRRALVTGVTTGLSDALGMSPSTDLTGQILKRGHFLQPTAMAIGQIVMVRASSEAKNNDLQYRPEAGFARSYLEVDGSNLAA
jgi:hypothetical protein